LTLDLRQDHFEKSRAPTAFGVDAIEYVPARATADLDRTAFDADGTNAVRVRVIGSDRQGTPDIVQFIVEPGALGNNPLPDLENFIYTRELDPSVLEGLSLPANVAAFGQTHPFSVVPDIVALRGANGATASTYSVGFRRSRWTDARSGDLHTTRVI
jgi:hypothetical protein